MESRNTQSIKQNEVEKLLSKEENMKKIIIKGIETEKITSEEYDNLFDALMQLGIMDIDIEEYDE